MDLSELSELDLIARLTNGCVISSDRVVRGIGEMTTLSPSGWDHLR